MDTATTNPKVIAAAEDVAAFVAEFPARSASCVCEPGNGSRYSVVLTPVTALSPGTVGGTGDRGWLISLPNYGTCYSVPSIGTLHADYVADKWFGGNMADGRALCEILREIGRRIDG